MAGRRAPREGGGAQVTSVVQDYLKLIWKLGERSDDPVTTTVLARGLGVGAPTVSETVQRLAAQGWVNHRPYHPVTLTPQGRDLALAMVRRHRLLETWLVRELGYGWDEVHDEAEVLEHAVSERFVDALDARLGHPWRDPHGDPIPTRDGSVRSVRGQPAGSLRDGEQGRVVRVVDDDPAVLRECAAAGVVVDAVVIGPVTLSAAALSAVRVEPTGAVSGDGSPAPSG
ncbi:MAG TPA: metal-dependent transcriptional regulator [Actinotalea sp.]|jgi:DtxR family Mn-dependent transcriptional regulator